MSEVVSESTSGILVPQPKRRRGNPNWVKGWKPSEAGGHAPWAKGHKGGPGRPKGIVGYIKAQTNDGQELIDLMLKVFRAQDCRTDDEKKRAKPRDSITLRDRLDALDWLITQGWGKPVERLEVSEGPPAGDLPSGDIDFGKLNDDEFETFIQLYRKTTTAAVVLEATGIEPRPDHEGQQR